MQVFLIQSHIWEDFTLVRSDSFLNRLGKRKENHSNFPPPPNTNSYEGYNHRCKLKSFKHVCWLVFCFVLIFRLVVLVNLTQVSVLWGKGTSLENKPPSDCLVSRSHLDNDPG